MIRQTENLYGSNNAITTHILMKKPKNTDFTFRVCRVNKKKSIDIIGYYG